jgi:hypothetical protein
MSDILDWLERLSELFILKLLTLGAWSKAYERYKTITFTEDFSHEQSIDELVQCRDLFVRAFEDLVHVQTIDEVVSIYGMVIEELLHSQSVDELVNIYSPEANVTLIMDLLYDLTTISTDLTPILSLLVDATTTNTSDATLTMDLSVEIEVS